MNHKQRFQWSNYLFIGMILAMMGLIFCLVFPYDMGGVKSPAKVITNPISQGDYLTYTIDACVNHKGPVTLTKRLVNNVVFTLPSNNIVPHKTGCFVENVTSIPIPEFIPDGTYVLEVTATHHVNFLRDVTVEWQTEPFEVKTK